MSEYKVIFHIDEINKWKLMLKNVSNLLNVTNEKFYIEVLANSEAVKYYETNKELNADVNTMESLNKKGVKFIACNNALMAYDIKSDNIIEFVNIVPAGVVELVKKQSEGYAYIKP
ncbi:DsrE family protein [Clostridium sp. YIM B02551]|uniref:DsrE family protein n=1 Tax=Clostridium sp. YIM B02551 TaxID=2910679 RepID=UPI001EEBD994|nr:DsrE family protein [Clostridium sp. YIM B02551]